MNYIKVVPVCPLIGKPCIGDGITSDTLMNHSTVYPCMLWDGNTMYNGVYPEQPCRMQRAIDRILCREIPDKPSNEPVVVPW